MCDTCGCGEPGETRIYIPGKDDAEQDHHHHDHHHDHDHSHDHGHPHDHDHPHDHNHSHHHDDHNKGPRKINLETDILGTNNLLAERNRGYFEAMQNYVINMISSPGSGKTTLLERTISMMGDKSKFYVIEGDQQTSNDAERIAGAGAEAIQVNTGNGCHLDAEMIKRAIKKLEPEKGSIIIIENVGNLVCPSLFDLGENRRVVLLSVTEGDDKPLKYPTIFETADLCVINKTDLIDYVDFDIDKFKNNGMSVNHHLQFLELSAKSGKGLEAWFDWLLNRK